MNSDTEKEKCKEIYLDYFKNMEEGDLHVVYTSIHGMMTGGRDEMYSYWISDGFVKSITIEPSTDEIITDSKITFELTEKGLTLIKFDQL